MANWESLILQARADDEAALDRLLDQGRGWVRNLVRRHGFFLRNGGDEDDLVQEGLIGFYEATLIWQPGAGAFGSLAETCVYRNLQEALTRANRQKRQPPTPIHSLDAPTRHNGNGWNCQERHDTWNLPDSSGLGRDPLEVVAEMNLYQPLMRYLTARLSYLELAAIRLVYVDEQSFAGAARILGRSPKAIDNAIHRAKRKVRRDKIRKKLEGLEGLLHDRIQLAAHA